jgi:hypothetical protein
MFVRTLSLVVVQVKSFTFRHIVVVHYLPLIVIEFLLVAL